MFDVIAPSGAGTLVGRGRFRSVGDERTTRKSVSRCKLCRDHCRNASWRAARAHVCVCAAPVRKRRTRVASFGGDGHPFTCVGIYTSRDRSTFRTFRPIHKHIISEYAWGLNGVYLCFRSESNVAKL